MGVGDREEGFFEGAGSSSSDSSSASLAGDNEFRDDYYSLLDVSPQADVRTVKLSYRRLMRRLHPDMGDPGDGVGSSSYSYLMSVITDARDTLCDPVRKKKYDARLGLSVIGVQEQVAEQREKEDVESMVAQAKDGVSVTGDMKVPVWRKGDIIRPARKVLTVLGIVLSVVTGIAVFNIGWGWVFLLIPFLSLWWGYLRASNAFNAGAWVVGVLGLALLVVKNGEWTAAADVFPLSVVWLLWAVVTGAVLLVGYNFVTPAKRIWRYDETWGTAGSSRATTGSLLDEVLVLPGAVVVHGLQVDVGEGQMVTCEHAVIAGKKVALVNTAELPVGDVRWDSSGRSLVINEHQLVDTDAAFAGNHMRDKDLKKAAGEIKGFVFCYQTEGKLQEQTGEFPTLVSPEAGLRQVVDWLMEDNDYTGTRKRLVESVWRFV